jgi:hypothetical protein
MGLPGFLRAQSESPPQTPQATEDLEFRARGPVHEAFATPTTNDPAEPIVITEQPPEPIEELPPECRPEGRNVIWIPGYWRGGKTR